ncbi:MAG: hypothetical protein KME08_11970 [Aphanothece sp. CMT-3BRIN-NPC111]|nr:hypothetical protein [Aphanothece sp. CMT-3BRIN-NPC111]
MNDSSEFKKRLEDDKTSIVTHFSSDSKTMLICFGGIQGALGIPPFEFFNLTSDFNTKKIYLRDLKQSWYHQGLPGIANSIDGVAKYLEQEVTKEQAKRVVTCGNSMGGYAAILFGSILNVDIVHSFSPQTFIAPIKRFIYRDKRWQNQIKDLYKADSTQKIFADLKKYINSNQTNKPVFNIYYSSKDRLDKIHAERMRNISNVVLHLYDEGGHGLVKHLRDTGLLKDILRKSLEL